MSVSSDVATGAVMKCSFADSKLAIGCWLWLWLLPLAACVAPPQQLICVNSDCTGIISTATTVTNYLNQANFLLSFKSNSKVRVLAKPKDPAEEYWGVEINGVYGFAPKKFLREKNIIVQPKKLVELKVFLHTIKEINYDNLERLDKERGEDKVAVEKSKIEHADIENNAEVDPTKSPSHKHKNEDPNESVNDNIDSTNNKENDPPKSTTYKNESENLQEDKNENTDSKETENDSEDEDENYEVTDSEEDDPEDEIPEDENEDADTTNGDEKDSTKPSNEPITKDPKEEEDEDIDSETYIEYDPTKPPSHRHKKKHHKEVENENVDTKTHLENDQTKPPSRKHKDENLEYKNDNIDTETNTDVDPTKSPSRRHRAENLEYKNDNIDTETNTDVDPTKSPSRRHRGENPENKNDNINTETNAEVDPTKAPSRKHRAENIEYKNYNIDAEINTDVDPTKSPSRRHRGENPEYKNDNIDTEVDPIKAPSRRHKDVEYYRNQRYRETEMLKKHKKHETEKLKQNSILRDQPIDTSTISDTEPDIDDINATQSMTVIDGTTIYSDSMKEEYINDNKLSYTVETVSSKSEFLNSKRDPSAINQNVETSDEANADKQYDNNLLKGNVNQEQIVSSASATATQLENQNISFAEQELDSSKIVKDEMSHSHVSTDTSINMTKHDENLDTVDPYSSLQEMNDTESNDDIVQADNIEISTEPTNILDNFNISNIDDNTNDSLNVNSESKDAKSEEQSSDDVIDTNTADPIAETLNNDNITVEGVTEQSDTVLNLAEEIVQQESPIHNYFYAEKKLDKNSENIIDNNFESSYTLDTISTTTVPSDTFDTTVQEDLTSFNEEVTEKTVFDYTDPLSDNIQSSNLLNSDIEKEKSFFSSPLILLNSMYESIYNIFKSNGIITNVIDKANTNVFTSEEIQSNDYNQPLESSDNSKKYMHMLTDTSHCSSEEKLGPSFSDISTDRIFWLVLSAVSVLLFTLGYYFLENRKQDGKLLAMVNSLQKELLCSSKECIILKEELSVTKEKLIGIENNSFGSDEMVACLKKELVDSQQTISDFQEKLSSAEEELANSTEAALELQSILDEQLSAKDTSSSSLAFTITNLQSQLDDQQNTMDLTKAQLTAKAEENELLLLKIMDANSKCASAEKKLTNTQELLQQAVQENENKNHQIEELALNSEKNLLLAETQKNLEVKELQFQIKNLKDELNMSKASVKGQTQELQYLQDSIKALQLDEKNISALLDIGNTKNELIKIVAEKKSLIEKLESENAIVEELNKKIDSQNSEISEVKQQLNESDQKTLQATTRLEVLTNYFNQKEADLLKELSTKESLWMSQQGEAMSTVEKIQSLQQEIQQHKDTAESIRREVVEQEAVWRTKVAALEQRVHEHWLARRAAERSAEASAREAQTLRQRLSAPSPDKRVVSPLTTGEVLPDPTYLPPLGAMLPPPPLGFLPPPLGGPMMLPPPLPPHRPPPLGRLSSPPPLQAMRPDRSYSPDSRYSPERDYSQQRGKSPYTNSESRRRTYNRRYDDRYYDSEEDRRSRRYETETDFSPVNTLPPSPIPTNHTNTRNHKGISSGSGHSYDSLEKYK